jgi:hypothetical protein
MAYPDGKRDMSENAKKAYRKGMFPLSKIRKSKLREHGFLYSVNFFKWLCKTGYLFPSEHHHTSASFRMTAFYSPKSISFAVHSLRLDNLFAIFKGKGTKDSLIAKENIKYVRIIASCTIFGLKSGKDVILDCIRYKNYLLYSEDSIIGTHSVSIGVLDEFDEKPDDWNNINTDGILHKIITRKKVTWNNVIGGN